MNTLRIFSTVPVLALCIFLSGCSYFFPPSGTLMGTVVDTEGQRIFYASVAVGNSEHQQFIRSDAAGHFTFSSVASGLHPLHITAQGYQPLDTKVWIPVDSALTLSFVLEPLARQTGTDSLHSSEPLCYGILTGTVTNPKGDPIVGVTVRVVGTERGAYTRPDGRFTIVRLESGDCTLAVTSIGFEVMRLPMTIPADTTVHIDVVMTPAESHNDCTLLIPRPMVDNNQIGTIRSVDMDAYHAP